MLGAAVLKFDRLNSTLKLLNEFIGAQFMAVNPA